MTLHPCGQSISRNDSNEDVVQPLELPNTIICTNIRSLYPNYDLTKTNTLFDLAKMKNSSLICLTETHLNNNISDFEILSEGWNIVRCDRAKRLCGGVAIYYSDIYSIIDRTSFSNSYCEMVGIYISELNLAVIIVYTTPNSKLKHFLEILFYI